MSVTTSNINHSKNSNVQDSSFKLFLPLQFIYGDGILTQSILILRVIEGSAANETFLAWSAVELISQKEGAWDYYTAIYSKYSKVGLN